MTDEITIFGNQNRPDSGDEVVLELPEAGLTLDTWTSYRFDSDFLEPSDGFDFQLAMDHVPSELQKALQPGAVVTLKVNGDLQATGYVDEVTYSNARGAGTELHIAGRDALAPVVDSCLDPRLHFSESLSLGELLAKIFIETYGFYFIDPSNDENRDVLTGTGVLQNQTRGVRTSKKKGKVSLRTALHRCQPYPHEGAFAFAARVAQLHGIWLWPTADGHGVIAGQPDFSQAPSFHLTRTEDGVNNILEGRVTRNGRDQPSIIVATGFGGGADFAHTTLKSKCINEITGLGDDDLPTDAVSKVFSAYDDAPQILATAHPDRSNRFARNMARPMFLHSDEAKTQDQLDLFVLREMALRQRHAITAEYTVKGHTQNGKPWAVDTIVDVQDDRCNLHGPMWVGRRTFTKSRSQGTQTRLSLILPHTMSFS